MKRNGRRSPLPESDRWKRDLGSSVFIKLLTMPLSALLGILSLRVVSDNYGFQGLALYGLVISIPLLLPFADLGLGGSVTEVVSSRTTSSRMAVMRTLRKAVFLLVAAGFAIVAGSLVLLLTGLWPSILGVAGDQASISASLVVAVFGISVPFAIGYRILLGLQLNRVVVLAQSISGILGAALVLALAGRIPLPIVIALPSIAGMVMSAGVTVYAYRCFRSDSETGSKIDKVEKVISLRTLAGPMLIIAISIPVVFQAHRIVLSHLGDTRALAAYTTAVQLYLPANALLITAGQSLWPRFSAMRESGSGLPSRAVERAMAAFVGVAVIGALGLLLLGPSVSEWITADSASAEHVLFLWFGILLVINAINYPVAMSMMGSSAVKFQSYCIATAALVSIPLMIVMGLVWGASGVVAATCVAILLFCVGPCYMFVRSHRSDPMEAVVAQEHA